MFVLMVYCLLYAPTLALTNSIAMSHLEDSEKEFGKIRVWGTHRVDRRRAGCSPRGVGWGDRPSMSQGDMLLLGGVLSIVMGLQSFAASAHAAQQGGREPVGIPRSRWGC